MTFDIGSAFTNSEAWYAAVQEARAKLHRENPRGVDVAAIGHEAWRQLTPLQQAHALDDLFVAYIVRIHDEERAAKLGKAAVEATTYLDGDDEYTLQDALADVPRPLAAHAQVTVCASALSNVLDELDLIRHRLTMRKQKEARK